MQAKHSRTRRSMTSATLGAVLAFALASVALFAVPMPQTPRNDYAFPRIPDAGGVVLLPDAAQQPRASAKIILDVTAQSEARELNKGLEKVARTVNLYAGAGVASERMKIAAVFHGPAANVVLSDEEYARHTGTPHNPNRKLLRQLKDAGVALYVCAQSLAHQGYAADEVAPEVQVAVSAISVLVNCQSDGYAYVPVQ